MTLNCRVCWNIINDDVDYVCNDNECDAYSICQQCFIKSLYKCPCKLSDTKYFFACIKSKWETYENYGMGHGSYKTGKYDKNTTTDVFSLDHYPNKKEIIDSVLERNTEYDEDTVYKIVSFNELTKEAYDAFRS